MRATTEGHHDRSHLFHQLQHKNEEWKDRVVTHLRVLEMEGMLDVWDDRRIEAGDDWRPEIEKAINSAGIAVLLVSANFLTSKFIHDDEVARLLERRAKEGVRVIPLIIKPCAWTQVKWLSPIQARPKDGKPLSAGNEHQIDTDLATLAEEIAKIVKRAGVGAGGRPPLRAPLPPDKISLGRALLQIRKTVEQVAPVQNPITNLNTAVDGLRQSDQQTYIPLGLLAHAEYYRVTGDLVKAQKDVDEVFTIATRGGMGLHLADCHLEFARLNVARFKGLNVQTFQPDNLPTEHVEARKHLVTAKEMINKMGYHRRDKEVEELEKELG